MPDPNSPVLVTRQVVQNVTINNTVLNLVKLTYRYVDNTNTTVQSVIWTAK